MNRDEFFKKYGLARKFNPTTGRNEFCLAVFVDDYPDFPIHFFGPRRPSAMEVEVKMGMAHIFEVQARNDFILKRFSYGAI